MAWWTKVAVVTMSRKADRAVCVHQAVGTLGRLDGATQ